MKIDPQHLNLTVHIAFVVAVLLGLYWSSFHSYLLFHSLVESARIAVAFAIFILAWNSRRWLENHYLVFVGIAYFFVAILELLHTLAYRGMGVFPAADANLPTQLWIAFRALEAATLLAAPAFIRYRLNPLLLFAAYAALTAALLASIFLGSFPDCFLEGTGLTQFKICSEYTIALAFLGALAMVWHWRREFSPGVLRLLTASLAAAAAAEIAFTKYVSVYGMANLVGHLLLLASTYFIYRAILVTGLVEPYDLLFRDLKQKEGELENRVAERTVELQDANQWLETELARRTRAELALREAKARYEGIFIGARDGIVLVDAESGRIADCNPEFERQCGRPLSELRDLHVWDLRPASQREAARQKFLGIRAAGEGGANNLDFERPDGNRVAIEFMTRRVRIDERDYLQSISRDITERKRAEDELRLASERNRLILESAGEGIYGLDRQGWIAFINPAAARMLGYGVEELIGAASHEAFHSRKADGSAYAKEECPIQRALGEGIVHRGTHEVYWRKDGKSFPVEYVSTPIREDGTIVGAVVTFNDITERTRAEEALRRSEAGLAEAQRIAQLGSWELDLLTNDLTWSDEIYRIFEIDPAEFGASYPAFLDAIHPEDRDRVDQAYSEHLKSSAAYDIVHRLLFKDGRIKYVREKCETSRDAAGRPMRSLGTVQDITEQRLAELRLRKLNRNLRTLSKCNEALVHATEENQLLQDMCRLIVEVGGLALAWVGYAEDDPARTVRVAAQYGDTGEYLRAAAITWADNERGQGPTGRAIRSGRPELADDIRTDAQFTPWRERALRHGFASSIALPLFDNAHVFGTLNIYSFEANAFADEEIRLLQELAADLAFGITTLRTRQERNLAVRERQEHLEKLRQSLEDTVEAIAAIVEIRDPYTAGHQRRVADLAAAIARELGIDEEEIRGIHLAGSVHDLGKVAIPAEILGKPGRLNDTELNFIKTHPQAGYNILKEVAFPWPIADMVRQHHEKLDGSGYPQGLTDKDILRGAKILAVADVVEAIASNRPYRPALGLDAALDEITANQSVLYDSAAVRACVTLFREKGYALRP